MYQTGNFLIFGLKFQLFNDSELTAQPVEDPSQDHLYIQEVNNHSLGLVVYLQMASIC